MRMNSCNFVGRVLADPKYAPSTGKDQASRLSFRIGVNRIKSDKYDVVNCTVWGAYADVCANNVRKGKELSITGELRTNSEQDAEGKWSNFWNINCERVGFGRDSAKYQQEKAAAGGDIDAVAAQLAAKAKAATSDSSPVAELAKKLVEGHGLSTEAALETAKAHFAGQSKATPASATGDDPFSA